jgi:hypothetical protein
MGVAGIVFATLLVLGAVLDRRVRGRREFRPNGFVVIEFLVVGTVVAIVVAALILATAGVRGS